MSGKQNQVIKITYKNWRGETGVRKIRPTTIWFGSTEWHPTDQWFMKAIDIEKNEERDFALQDIISWKTDGR